MPVGTGTRAGLASVRRITMIRVIFNEGIMDANPIEVLELPANGKINSKLWRHINDRAMCMAAREAETGIVSVYVYRVQDEEDPWYKDSEYGIPYGEHVCSGLAVQGLNDVTMDWWLPGKIRKWTYRTVKEAYHDD